MAMDAASRKALREALTQLPTDTTLGSLLDDLGASRPAEVLRSLPLHELTTLLNGNGDSTPKRGAPKRRKSRQKTTPNGSVRSYLRKAGKAKAEEIRAEVGGSPEEIRRVLFELKDERVARRTGQGRATVWHWKG